jgi:PPOX class probable F420-dependent enzyme
MVAPRDAASVVPLRGHYEYERTNRAPGLADAYIAAATLLAATTMMAAGIAALVWPHAFADFANFPDSVHFVHDAGAFQVGIGATLLLALIWRDALTVALAGFFVSNTIHAINHGIDLGIGGHDTDPWLLGAISISTGVALVLRSRQLGYVVGRVGLATSPALAPFVEQKTALLTTYRREGTPVRTPLSIAVDGNRAFFRSYANAGKTRRLHNNPIIELAPSKTKGTPVGPTIRGRARLLNGPEAKHAARLLSRKHPLLQGVMVPLIHRVSRSKTGRTVHFELTPLDV